MIQQGSIESQSRYPGRTACLEGDTIVIHIPMTFRKRSGRKEIILPEGAVVNEPPKPKTNRPLLLALARAYKWQKMLDTGEAESLDELATKYYVDRSYIGRLLGLMSLAPDLIVAILRGEEPAGVSLNKLTATGFPMLWSRQRETLGPQLPQPVSANQRMRA